MNTLFALVLSIGMTDGSYQDVVVDVYDSFSQCRSAAAEQRVDGECYPIDDIIQGDDQRPAIEHIEF